MSKKDLRTTVGEIKEDLFKSEKEALVDFFRPEVAPLEKSEKKAERHHHFEIKHFWMAGKPDHKMNYHGVHDDKAAAHAHIKSKRQKATSYAVPESQLGEFLENHNESSRSKEKETGVESADRTNAAIKKNDKFKVD